MITAILCAAGSGTRTGFRENKVLHDLGGMPVLCHSLSAFAPFADEILVACREEDGAKISPLLSPYGNARTVPGGATRMRSVYNALKEAKGDIVLIHDAARPHVSHELIGRVLESVQKRGSGVAALPVTDTVVLTENGYVLPPRESAFLLQTPQGFLREPLLTAYEKAVASGKTFTDDSGIYAAYVAPPVLVPGEAANKKLTFAEDFLPCERVGFGVDTHAFEHQEEIDRGIARLNLNYITLCGTVIPSNRALEAHSDGDVPVHALMDALLSAAGLRDIGYYFPDSDGKYRGANSMELLAEVMEMIHGGGFFVANASISILCELPRLSPYIEKMRENLRAALGCEQVAIAAGTNEKLGYIGEGRGITAYAMVLLTKQGSDYLPPLNSLGGG